MRVMVVPIVAGALGRSQKASKIDQSNRKSDEE